VASDKEVWQKAKDDGFVILTRDADFQELSLVWGQPPKVIRLKTLNQSRAATLKVLIENRDVIVETLLTQGLASVEIVP
jgi:predicted nuclease of predicted toxin-antitoxin system